MVLDHVVIYGPTQVLFPRSVTEEQEAYARGFLDALVELQRQRQQAAASPLVQVIDYHHQPTSGLVPFRSCVI